MQKIAPRAALALVPSADEDLRLDEDGRIIPSRAALEKVEREMPHASAGKKWLLAQTQTMLDSSAVQRAFRAAKAKSARNRAKR